MKKNTHRFTIRMGAEHGHTLTDNKLGVYVEMEDAKDSEKFQVSTAICSALDMVK